LQKSNLKQSPVQKNIQSHQLNLTISLTATTSMPASSHQKTESFE